MPMHAVHIDTLKAVEELESTGIDKTQARAFVSLVNRAFGENVATKDDLKLLKSDMAAEFTAVRAEITEVRSEITEVKSELRQEITRSQHRIIGIIGGLIGFLFVVDRLLPLFGIG